MSTALRIKVTERVEGPDPNAGPAITGATVIVNKSVSVDAFGIATIPQVDVTVTAPGYESYIKQPYNLETALSPPGQTQPPLTRVSLRRL